MQRSSHMPDLLDQIRLAPDMVERLPPEERAIVRGALEGKNVHEVAADCRTSEAHVWQVLSRAARAAAGARRQPSESAGQMPQTRHPSQAEGDDPPSAQEPRPSQGEGKEG